MDGSSSMIQCPPPKRNRSETDVDSSAHAIDRISNLPDLVLHHILNFLPTKDAIRTSILSKPWYRASTSFPISDFSESLFIPDFVHDDPLDYLMYIAGLLKERTREFLKFMLNSLQRQCHCYKTIPRFALSMSHYFNHTSCIDECIQLATQYNVKELDLFFTDSQRNDGHYYVLPQTLFSARDFVLLRLNGCQLTLSLTHGGVNWPSLRHLCLEHCHVDEVTVQNLISGCPFIEKLILSSCSGNEGIRISGLTKLAEFSFTKIFTSHQLYKLLIDAPCLKTFCLSAGGHCSLDVVTCRNLVTLEIKHYPENLTSQDLTDLISRLHDLKSLGLNWKLERIKFSGKKLEKLELWAGRLVEDDLTELISGLPALKFLVLQCYAERIIFLSQQLEKLTLFMPDESFFDDVKFYGIDAPSLKTFHCDSGMLFSDFSVSRSSPQIVTISYHNPYYFYTSCILKLRELLGSFNRIELLKLSFISTPIEFVPAKLEDILLPAPPDIKRLELDVTYECLPGEDQGVTEIDHKALMGGLLWICHPGSVSLHPHRFCNDVMMKVFCQELTESTAVYPCKSSAVFSEELMVSVRSLHCCATGDIKCWRHYLKSFQIKQVRENGDWEALTCDDLLESLPTLPLRQVLYLTCRVERVKISSQQLENLKLVCCSSELLEVSIDAPCLKKITCTETTIWSEFSVARSSLQELAIRFEARLNTSDFLKIRQFLGNFNQIELLDLFYYSTCFLFLSTELTNILVPALPDVKHVKLRVEDGYLSVGGGVLERADSRAFMNRLLWSCHPESVSVITLPSAFFVIEVF